MILSETNTPEQLIFILALHNATRIPVLQATLASARFLKSGHYGKAKLYLYDPLFKNIIASEKDKNVCQMLEHSRVQLDELTESGFYNLRDKKGAELLQHLLLTEHCFWGSSEGKPLILSDEKEAHFSWQFLENGMQRLQCRVFGSNFLIMPLNPLWYVDITERTCGPLKTEFDPRLAIALLAAPPMTADQIKKFYAELERREITIKISETRVKSKKIKHETHTPLPMLRLFGRELPGNFSKKQDPEYISLAQLKFNYCGECIAWDDPQEELTIKIGKQHVAVSRDYVNEEKFKQHLVTMDVKEPNEEQKNYFYLDQNENYFFICQPRDRAAQLNFMLKQVPQLESEGWQVIVDESFPLRIVHDTGDWYSQIEENINRDWFGFELGIMIGAKRVNLLPLLLDLIQQYIHQYGLKNIHDIPDNTTLLVQLPNKSYLPLQVERVRGILNVLTELYDNESLYGDEKLRLPKMRIAQLLELEKAMGVTKMRWLGGEKLRVLGEKLRNFEGIKPIKVPKSLIAQLRPYQHEGLNWLQFLREFELGGILADDMGLGKTIQALAHVLVEKKSGRMDKPCLVVAPTSLMLNWRIEADRFAPSLKVLTLHGHNRQKHFPKISKYDLVLTTYPLLIRDKEALLKREYHLLILDEAQVIKNSKAKSTQIVLQLNARHRICLTGTPMENHLGELWSLFNFLLPGLLGTHAEFKRLFSNPIEKANDMERQVSLATRVAPFMLRRTKQEVVKELPSKTEITCNVELEGAQLDLYESIRVALHEKVVDAIRHKGLERSQIIVLDALLKLRQVCCDPRLLKLEAAKKIHHSVKLNLLMDMLPNLVAEGRRILLFSSFTSMLKLIEEELTKHKFVYEKLTGQTKDRAVPIQRFQNGEVPLFLVSLKAGGLGLNLTAADTVIHYDPWWNPAAEHQATDRAHRIGQDKAVFVYKLVTTGTVEEKIVAMQQKKQALLEGIFNQQANAKSHLTAKDLEYLFQPLEIQTEKP